MSDRRSQPGEIIMEITVFLIENDPVDRTQLAISLEGAGFFVHDFVSCERFLGAVKADAKGCVVLDIQHRQTSELALMEELKKRELKLPVIVTSGEVLSDVEASASAAGAFAFLAKPYRTQELFRVIRDALAHLDAGDCPSQQ
jgi:two-component system, LuxR family, response regulator FixJ